MKENMCSSNLLVTSANPRLNKIKAYDWLNFISFLTSETLYNRSSAKLDVKPNVSRPLTLTVD